MSQDIFKNFGQDQNQQVGDVSIDGQGHYVDFSLKQYIQISVDEIKTKPFIKTSPYKGLKKFDSSEWDAKRFWGREQLIEDLHKDLSASNMLLLLGASGSGKSSVVSAGLIPKLAEEWGANLVTLTLTPDENPFESLYASLLRSSVVKQADAKIAQQAEPDTLTRIINQKSKDSFWLIFLDQFEELFTLSSEQERNQFIAGLIYLHNALDCAKQRSVKVIMTMRADFSDRLSPYAEFSNITKGQIRFIADMQEHELRRAIEQPAAHHGVVFEEGLVEEIIKDVQGQAASLPLLQYTLDQLWQRESISDQMRSLRKRTYWTLGGVSGALQNRVDEIYRQLCQAGKERAVKQIFLRLVSIDGSRVARRRAYRNEFEANPAKNAIVDELIQEVLLVSDVDRAGQRTVEIAHEALFTSWSTLRNWIAEDGQAITLKNRLADAVGRWLKANADETDSELWRGSTLDEVVKLRKEGAFERLDISLNSDEGQFVDDSFELSDRQRREEEQRQQKELESARKLAVEAEARRQAEEEARLQAEKTTKQEIRARQAAQARTKVAVISAVCVLGLTGATFWQWQRAEKQRIEIAEQSEAILARQLAAQAELASRQQTAQPELSILLALESLRRNSSPEARQVIREGFPKLFSLSQQRSVGEAQLYEFSPDGNYLATVDESNVVQVQKTSSGEFIFKFQFQDGVNEDSIHFSADSKYFAVVDGNILKIQELATQRELSNIVYKGENSKNKISFASNSEYLTIDSYRDSASIIHDSEFWRLSDEQLISRIERVQEATLGPDGQTILILRSSQEDLSQLPKFVLSILSLHNQQELPLFSTGDGHANKYTLSPDGRYFVMDNLGGGINFFDLETNQKTPLPAGVPRSGVNKFTFSSDQKYLGIEFVPSDIVQVLDLEKNELISIDNSYHKAFAFSPGSQYFAIANDELVMVRDSNGFNLTRAYKGIENLVFSPNDKYLAVVTSEAVHVLDVEREAEILSQPLRISDLSLGKNQLFVLFSSDSGYLALSEKNRVSIWDTSKPDGLIDNLSFQAPVASMKFDVDSKSLAVVSSDGELKLWNASSEQTIPFVIERDYEEQIFDISFSPDNQYFATIFSKDGDAVAEVLSNIDSQSLLKKNVIYEERTLQITDAVSLFTQESRFIVVGYETRSTQNVHIFDTQNDQFNSAIRLSAEQDSASVPNTKYLVQMVDDSFQIRDSTNNEIIQPAPSSKNINSVTSPDGQYRAVIDGDNVVRVLEVNSDQEIDRLEHGDKITHVVFSSDSNYLATGSVDGQAKRLRLVDADTIVFEVCDQLTRNLTKEEWEEYMGEREYQKTCENLP